MPERHHTLYNVQFHIIEEAIHAINQTVTLVSHHRPTPSQGWGQVQLVKYSNTSSTRNQVQVQVLCIFTNQVLKYIKY